MPTGQELFNQLPENVRRINGSLDELVRVLAGDLPVGEFPGNCNGKRFDPAWVWPASNITIPDGVTQQAADVLNCMKGAGIDPDLQSTINKLFEGIGSGSPIKNALHAGIEKLNQYLQAASQQVQDLQVGDRLDAFNKLNNPHAPATFGTPDFGYIPAIEGLINALAGTNVDVDDALNQLRNLQGAIAAGSSYAIFVAYFTGAIDMLVRSLPF